MATKTVGRLKIQLDAVTNRFDKGMKAASTRVSKFKEKITRIGVGVAKFGKLLAGIGVIAAGVAGAIVLMVTNSLAAIDKIGKTSSKLGIAAENLSALHHAAKMTGVNTETLDMALQRMVRRVAEAAMGTGEAVGALEELGISAKELNTLAPDAQFVALAEAMANVTGQGDRVRLAMKLFDSEGVALVNTLELGRQGLIDMAEEAESLGVVFGDYEVSMAAIATDAFERMKASFGGLRDMIAIELAPILTVLFKRIEEWVTTSEVSFQDLADSLTPFKTALLGILTVFDTMILGIKIILNGLKGVVGAAAVVSGLGVGVVENMLGLDPRSGLGKDMAVWGDEVLEGVAESVGKMLDQWGDGSLRDRIFGVENGATKEKSSIRKKAEDFFSNFWSDVEKEREGARKQAEERIRKRNAQAEAVAEKEEKEIKPFVDTVGKGPDRLGAILALAKGKAEQRVGPQQAAMVSPLEILRVQREQRREAQETHDRNTERTANLLQYMVDNGIPLAVGSTP